MASCFSKNILNNIPPPFITEKMFSFYVLYYSSRVGRTAGFKYSMQNWLSWFYKLDVLTPIMREISPNIEALSANT